MPIDIGRIPHKIPTAETSTHKLQSLQKNAHTVLTKCKDVCYLTNDCSVLEAVIQNAEEVYHELVESADPSIFWLIILLIFPGKEQNYCSKVFLQRMSLRSHAL